LPPGERFAKAYVHAGMVALDGEKMSKSRGNLEFVSRLRRDGVGPAVIRLALLAHHYRSDWEWTADELTAAERRLESWQDALARASAEDAAALVAQTRDHLADDLDAPAALAAVDAWAASAEGDGSGADLLHRLRDAR